MHRQAKDKQNWMNWVPAKYMKDHPPNDIRNEFLPSLVRVRATSLPPEKAVPFMKEALQQYLKDHGKDDIYWALLSVMGNTFINLGLKHQASKIFKKMKQSDQAFSDSTVSTRPISCLCSFSLPVFQDCGGHQLCHPKGSSNHRTIRGQGNNPERLFPRNLLRLPQSTSDQRTRIS